MEKRCYRCPHLIDNDELAWELLPCGHTFHYWCLNIAKAERVEILLHLAKEKRRLVDICPFCNEEIITKQIIKNDNNNNGKNGDGNDTVGD